MWAEIIEHRIKLSLPSSLLLPSLSSYAERDDDLTDCGPAHFSH